jgi:Tol biopolymer transport system component
LDSTVFERYGKQEGTAFNLSHNDKQVALSAFGADSSTQDIWLLDVERGVSSRFTSDPAMDQNAAWSPDDKEIVFSSTRKGAYAERGFANSRPDSRPERNTVGAEDRVLTGWENHLRAPRMVK